MKWGWPFRHESPTTNLEMTLLEADVMASRILGALERAGALREYSEAGKASVRALILRTLTERV